MRLTLRTMLAFLDDLLEPADAQEVGKRIEESEFATSLMHRTRDVTRRLRLGAPKLEGRGMGLDPNTVAEYLDHALPPERVPDFEKVCLESDVHLAEVASAHQILALVLGEPAEVDPDMRRRMYEIAAQASAAAESEEDVEEASPPGIEITTRRSKDGKKSRRRPEVPDYLREKKRRRRWIPLLAGAAALLLVAGGLVLALGPTQGWRWLVASSSSAEDQKTPSDETLLSDAGSARPAAAPTEGATPAAETNGGVGAAAAPAATSATPPDEAAKGGDTKRTPPALIAPSETSPNAAPPAENAKSPAAPIPAKETAPSPDAAPPVVPAPATTGPATPGPTATGPTATNPAAPAPSAPATKAGSPAGSPSAPAPTEKAPTEKSAAVPGAARPAVPGAPVQPMVEPVGSLATDVEVLLRLDRKLISGTVPASQAWQRVSSRELLYPGDELVVLPTFRTNVVLSAGGGVKAQFLGGAIFALEAPDQNGVPGIRISEGRVILMPAGKPETQIRLVVGRLHGVLVFGDADATAAIEVRRALPDGADPLDRENHPALVTVDLYVPAGEVRWISGMGGMEDSIKAPGHRVMGPSAQQFEAVPTAAKDFPEWIAGTGPSGAEKRTTEDMEKELAIGKPVHLRLKEIAYRDRRVEWKSLAARCLFQIGDFETFLPLLSDPNQKSYWTTQIEAVRTAMARNPEVATDLKNTMSSQRDIKTADELFRMLWGYDRDQLRNGAATRLVNSLDHQDLDVRVLSLWNLYHVTGFTQNYRPQDTQAKRQQGVRAWKQKLTDDLIVPK